jgi:Leucine-rich repeat (LRR) protein
MSSKYMGGHVGAAMLSSFECAYSEWSARLGVARVPEADLHLAKMGACIRAGRVPACTKLVLRKCGVTNVQAVALAEALAEFPVLSKLDLRDNRLTNEAAAALQQAVRTQCVRYIRHNDAAIEDPAGRDIKLALGLEMQEEKRLRTDWLHGGLVLLQKIKIGGNCVYDKPLLRSLQAQCDSAEKFNVMVRARFLVYQKQEGQILTGGHVEVAAPDAVAVCKKLSVPQPKAFVGEGGICVEELIEKIIQAIGFNEALKSLGHKYHLKSRRQSVVDRAGMLVDTAKGEPSPRSMAAAVSSDAQLYDTAELQRAVEEGERKQERKQKKRKAKREAAGQEAKAREQERAESAAATDAKQRDSADGSASASDNRQRRPEDAASVGGESRSSLPSGAVEPTHPLSVRVDIGSSKNSNAGNTPVIPSPWSSGFQSFESSLAKGRRRKMSMSRSEYYKQNSTFSDVAERAVIEAKGSQDGGGDRPSSLLQAVSEDDNDGGSSVRGSGSSSHSNKRPTSMTDQNSGDHDDGSFARETSTPSLKKSRKGAGPPYGSGDGSGSSSADNTFLNSGSSSTTAPQARDKDSTDGDCKDQRHDGIQTSRPSSGTSSAGPNGNTADPDMSSLWQEDGGLGGPDSPPDSKHHHHHHHIDSGGEYHEDSGDYADSLATEDDDVGGRGRGGGGGGRGAMVAVYPTERVEMNFSGRKIQSFNRTGIDWVAISGRLTVLNLSNNRLSSLGIKTVGVDGQLTDTTPPPIPFLIELDLSRNNIQHLGDRAFAGYPELRHLDLSHNKIRRINGLESSFNLETLSIANNDLRIVGGIGQLHSLQDLDLSHNCISKIVSLRPLSMNIGLKKLSLVGNPVGGYGGKTTGGRARNGSRSRDINGYASLRPCVISFVPHLLALDGVPIPPSSMQHRARTVRERQQKSKAAQTKKKKILVGTNNTKRLTAGRARQNERTSYARGASSTTNGHRNRRTVDHAHAHEKKSYPSPASASPQSGAAEEDTDWREELELLSMARQNRSSRPSSALGSGDAEKSDLGMSSALDSLKSKIRDSVALAAEKKTTVDPVRQRARMKILSRPVREDGRKKKKEIESMKASTELPGFGGRPLPNGYRPGPPEIPADGLDDDEGVAIEAGTALNVAEILRRSAGPSSPRSSRSRNRGKRRKSPGSDADMSPEAKAKAKKAAKIAVAQRKRCNDLSKAGAPKPREKVVDVVLRGHTAGLAFTGAADKGLFQAAAASCVTVKGVGVSAFTMPGPAGRPAWNSGNGGKHQGDPEAESLLEKQRKKMALSNAKKLRHHQERQIEDHVRRMQLRTQRRFSLSSFGAGFPVSVPTKNVVAQEVRQLEELRLRALDIETMDKAGLAANELSYDYVRGLGPWGKQRPLSPASRLLNLKMKELDIIKQQEEKLQSLHDEQRKRVSARANRRTPNVTPVARVAAKVSTWLAPEYIVIIQAVFDRVAVPAHSIIPGSGRDGLAQDETVAHCQHLVSALRSDPEFGARAHLPLRTGRQIDGLEEWITLDECVDELEDMVGALADLNSPAAFITMAQFLALFSVTDDGGGGMAELGASSHSLHSDGQSGHMTPPLPAVMSVHIGRRGNGASPTMMQLRKARQNYGNRSPVVDASSVNSATAAIALGVGAHLTMAGGGVNVKSPQKRGDGSSSVDAVEDIVALTRVRQWMAEAEHDLSAADTALDMLVRVHERVDASGGGYDRVFLENFYQRLQDMEVVPDDEMMTYDIFDVAERAARIRGSKKQRPLLRSLVPPNIQLAAQALPLQHPDRDAVLVLHDALLTTKKTLGRLIGAMLRGEPAGEVDRIVGIMRNSDIGARMQVRNNETGSGEISESESYHRGSDMGYPQRPTAVHHHHAYDARSIASSEWSVEAHPPSVSGMSNAGNRGKRRSNNQSNHGGVRLGSRSENRSRNKNHANSGGNGSNVPSGDESEVGSLHAKSEVAYDGSAAGSLIGDSAPPSVFSDDHLSVAGSATSEFNKEMKEQQQTEDIMHRDELMNMLDGVSGGDRASALSGGETPPNDGNAASSAAAAAAAVAKEEPAEAGASRNVLRVDILSCSDLRNADGPGSKSDPYVVVKIGKKKGRSRTVKSHLHPVFNERLEFRVEAPSPAPLNIEVWDKDLMSDDRLGHIEPLDLNCLEALCTGRRYEMELLLVGKKAKKGSTVTIALEWYFSDYVRSMGKGKEKETVKPVEIPEEELVAGQDGEEQGGGGESKGEGAAAAQLAVGEEEEDKEKEKAEEEEGEGAAAAEPAEGEEDEDEEEEEEKGEEEEEAVVVEEEEEEEEESYQDQVPAPSSGGENNVGLVPPAVNRRKEEISGAAHGVPQRAARRELATTSNRLPKVGGGSGSGSRGSGGGINAPSASEHAHPVSDIDSETHEEDPGQASSSPTSASSIEMSIEARIAAALAGGDDTSAGESSGLEGSVTGGGSATDATDDWDDDDLAGLME